MIHKTQNSVSRNQNLNLIESMPLDSAALRCFEERVAVDVAGQTKWQKPARDRRPGFPILTPQRARLGAPDPLVSWPS